ncbi:hypothetical protein ABZS88_35890, partial [Streptomyces sp. NPDC005480]|uniref:hypothetical protein n=1 Tax=Streptomyces sp. NPDC005480 TaxID=3154880 RepID=UPI0033B9EF21
NLRTLRRFASPPHDAIPPRRKRLGFLARVSLKTLTVRRAWVGVATLVLHPLRGWFGWVNGRVFEQMEPSLGLDRRLSRQEAANWPPPTPFPGPTRPSST